MSKTDDQNRIIEHLATHEEMVAKLYQRYSKILTDNPQLWSKLSAEEIQHAKWLRRLKQRVQNGAGAIDCSKFKAEEIESSIKNIQSLIDQSDQNPPDMAHALKTALKIEESILENKYFEIFSGDEDFTHVLYLLEQETADHRQRIINEAAKH